MERRQGFSGARTPELPPIPRAFPCKSIVYYIITPWIAQGNITPRRRRTEENSPVGRIALERSRCICAPLRPDAAAGK